VKAGSSAHSLLRLLREAATPGLGENWLGILIMLRFFSKNLKKQITKVLYIDFIILQTF
jgi:hypothetical protein